MFDVLHDVLPKNPPPATNAKIRPTTTRTTTTTIIGTSSVLGRALNFRQPQAIASVALYGLVSTGTP